MYSVSLNLFSLPRWLSVLRSMCTSIHRPTYLRARRFSYWYIYGIYSLTPTRTVNCRDLLGRNTTRWFAITLIVWKLNKFLSNIMKMQNSSMTDSLCFLRIISFPATIRKGLILAACFLGTGGLLTSKLQAQHCKSTSPNNS